MRGSTVEMSFLMPVIFLLIMSSIFGMFYYHDKNVICGAAYETVAVGSTKARNQGGTGEGEIRALFEERVRGKCILFDRMEVTVSMEENEIEVAVTASKRRMRLSVLKRMRITDPETKIRNIRRLK